MTSTRSRPKRLGFSLVELLVVIAVLAILAAILMPALARAREASLRAGCANNLRQVGMSLRMYAHENDGYFPPLQGFSQECDTIPINLMFDGPAMVPAYLDDVRLLVCPSDLDGEASIEAGRWRKRGDTDPCRLDSLSYAYVPWALDEEYLTQGGDRLSRDFLSAFAHAARSLNEGGQRVFDWQFKDESGATHNVLYLRDGVERFVENDSPKHLRGTVPESNVPVMFDAVNVDVQDFNHVPGGANVLFMDGHVAFEKYPSGRDYPVSRAWARTMNIPSEELARMAEPGDADAGSAPSRSEPPAAQPAGETPWWAAMAPSSAAGRGSSPARYYVAAPPPLPSGFVPILEQTPEASSLEEPDLEPPSPREAWETFTFEVPGRERRWSASSSGGGSGRDLDYGQPLTKPTASVEQAEYVFRPSNGGDGSSPGGSESSGWLSEDSNSDEDSAPSFILNPVSPLR